MRSLSLFYLVLAVGLASPATAAGIQASVDNDRVAPGETIELTLAYDGQVNSQPDIAPLARDFDVLSTSRSSSVRIVNGARSAETQLRLTLSPKRSGQLAIPALTWQAAQSSPIAITVDRNGSSQNATTPQAQSSNVFFKTTVDDSHPYVQGAVKLTVQLYAGGPLYDASVTLPASGNVLIEQLGNDRSSSTEVNGHRYNVIERDYLLFPQHSGTLEIPGPILDAHVPTGARRSILPNDLFSGLLDQSSIAAMMQTERPIRLHGDSIALEVRPRPALATTSYWIPAKKLTVTSRWHPDSFEVRSGEPITLDLRMRAEGLTAAQLPDLASLVRLPPGLDAHPDRPKLENLADNGTVIGTREQSIALIADRAGTFDVPALKIQWWDTSADQLRSIELPAFTIKALPNESGNDPTPSKHAGQGALQPASEGSQQSGSAPFSGLGHGPWRWVSGFVLAALLLGIAVRWWLSRSRDRGASVTPRSTPVASRDGSRARSTFLAACKRNDAGSARRALLDWARTRWPVSPPIVGLRDVAARLDDPEITARLRELDRACFAGDAWNGAGLAQVIERLPRSSNKQRGVQRPALAELYPQA